ncbi:MAG: hypothetical protein OEO23_06220 [Gemmatimonadota bacterium]|nr:hypothetical protein [Gemmatimonadota bacterium]
MRVPRAPIPPSARQLGRMALGGMQASGSASQGSTAEESEAGPSRSDAGDHPKGPSVAFAVGLTLVVVASLVLVLFFALWDFEGPAPAEEPVAEPVTADSVG